MNKNIKALAAKKAAVSDPLIDRQRVKKKSNGNKPGPMDDIKRFGSSAVKGIGGALKGSAEFGKDLGWYSKEMGKGFVEMTPDMVSTWAVPAAKRIGLSTPGVATFNYIRKKMNPQKPPSYQKNKFYRGKS